MAHELNNPDTRQSILAGRAKNGQQLIAGDLASEFDVSLDTIRRDILALERLRLVQRVRGGAVPVSTPAPPLKVRSAHQHPELSNLAMAALKHIQNGMVVMLDGGTSVLELARHLTRFPECVVVTPAPLVADAANAAGLQVILVGGRLSPFGGICVGATAEKALAQVSADICFLGACAIDSKFGVSTDDFDENGVKIAMRESSNKGIVLSSNDKIGKKSRYRTLTPEAVDLLITNQSETSREALANSSFEVEFV